MKHDSRNTPRDELLAWTKPLLKVGTEAKDVGMLRHVAELLHAEGWHLHSSSLRDLADRIDRSLP